MRATETDEEWAAYKKQRLAAWREKNREKVREYHRNYQNTEAYKEGRKEYKAENSERIKSWYQEHYLKNKDKIIAQQLARRALFPEEHKARSSRHYFNNKSQYRAKDAKRRAQEMSATPKWLSEAHIEQMKDIYRKCEEMTRETGEAHNVDHLYPLQGKNVCGLHVPWNLVVIPHKENMSKGNKHPEDFYGDRFPAMLAKTTSPYPVTH